MKPNRRFGRFAVTVSMALLWAFPFTATAEERLAYNAEYKGPVSVYAWIGMGSAWVTTRDTPCPSADPCQVTELWMSSEGKSTLESLYPTRYLYRTAYSLEKGDTLAYEKRRKKRKVEDAAEYQWKHRVVWLDRTGGSGTRFDLAYAGDPLPEAAAAWIDSSVATAGALKSKKNRKLERARPSMDRWAIFQYLRTLDLSAEKEFRFDGVNSKGPLDIRVTVEGREELEAAGETWSTYRLRILEQSAREDKKAEPLYAWIADDARRTPVRFEMSHDIGRIRLTLKSPGDP
ncbi:MAG: DUF3108 domain-containing protein [Pseudomonadota bacterium]